MRARYSDERHLSPHELQRINCISLTGSGAFIERVSPAVGHNNSIDFDSPPRIGLDIVRGVTVNCWRPANYPGGAHVSHSPGLVRIDLQMDSSRTGLDPRQTGVHMPSWHRAELQASESNKL